MKDYYAILGIPGDADGEHIKKAYRALAKRFHPDVVKDNKEKQRRMYDIQEAYQCLGNAESREKYDRARRQEHDGMHRREKREAGFERAPGSAAFERFFGFRPGEGMESYQNHENFRKPRGSVRSDEMFATFFGMSDRKGDR